MRVLVTDSDTRSALAAVRSLGRCGHEVVVAGRRHPSLASVSRFAAAFEVYPDPMHDAAAFMPAIAEIAERRRIEALLPMTEVTTLLAAQHRALLPPGCVLPFADAAAIMQASDKAHVTTLAAARGIPVPKTVVVGSAAEAREHVAALTWPTVVKPARSRVRVGSGWHSNSVAYAGDARELTSRLEALPAAAFPVLLQEKIEGPGVGVFSCFDRGRHVAVFAHRRLREKPPSGGVSVLCESVAADPVAVEHAGDLLAALDWRGVAMVEFKQDARDGSLRLMEINGRFWGSLQLAVTAGVDFPALLVELARETDSARPTGASAPRPTYRLGVRSRWLGGDLDALLIRLLHARERLNLPVGHPGRWRSLLDFLCFAGRDLHYEIEQRDDLAPARLEWRRRLLPG